MITALPIGQLFFLSALYLAGCAWVGFAFLTLLFRRVASSATCENGHLWLFFSLACGMSLHMTALFFLSLIGYFDVAGMTAVSLALVVAPVPLLFFYGGIGNKWRTLTIRMPDWRSAANGGFNALLLAGLFLVIASFAVHAPGHWDDTSYHLPYARYYLDNHQLQVNEYLRFPLFPNQLELLLAFGLAYGGVTLAQALATLPLFVIAVGLMGAGRRFLNSVHAGLLATAIILYVGPISGTLGYAYVDDSLALFCWAALLALLQRRAVPNTLDAWIFVASLLAATAASIKLFGVIWAGLLAVYVLLETRRLRPALVFGAGIAILGSWWYIRSLWISGDPIHPAGAPMFGYYLWNAQDLLAQQQHLEAFNLGNHLSDWWGALTRAQATLIAPAFFAPLFFRRTDRPLVYAYGLFVAYFVFWITYAQVSRYLAPALALAGFLTVFVVYRAGLSSLASRAALRWPVLGSPVVNSMTLALLVGLMVPVALVNAQRNLDSWTTVLESRAGYTLYEQANALIPEKGPRLIQIGFENGLFYYRGEAIGDWFGPGRYSQFLECAKDCKLIAPSAMVGIMNQLGSRTFIFNIQRNAIDLDAYRRYFDVRATASDGYLLTLKD